MQPRKNVAILSVSIVAWIASACDNTRPPTQPASTERVTASLTTPSPTRWVNDDDPNGGDYVPLGTSCRNPGYPTIQSAVDAAAPGDLIKVCPGTYTEQVSIPAGKDNLRLVSTSRWQAVIKAPSTMTPGPAGTYSLVRISGSQNVMLLAFTITGPGPGTCESLHYGIRVDEGAFVKILGNRITDIRDEPLSNCFSGIAILVGRRSEGTTGTANIIGNVIESYQRIGVTVSNVGSSATITNNLVYGIGPNAVLAQVGIQASGGGGATLKNNFVARNVYTPQTEVSAGILGDQSGKVLIDNNTAAANDVGIYLYAAAADSRIQDNRVRASTFDGISLQGGGNITIFHNDVDHNNGPGISLTFSQTNRLTNNEIESNGDSGLLFFGANNNTVMSNNIKANGIGTSDGTDGIQLVFGATTNKIKYNNLKLNATHDCHDWGSGNVWVDNRAESSFPAKLCMLVPLADDPTYDPKTSGLFGWDPTYAWYGQFVEAADLDWTGEYAAYDTESLLALIDAVKTGAIRGRPLPPSP